jgi:hypothetical protein
MCIYQKFYEEKQRRERHRLMATIISKWPGRAKIRMKQKNKPCSTCMNCRKISVEALHKEHVVLPPGIARSQHQGGGRIAGSQEEGLEGHSNNLGIYAVCGKLIK